jgi:predicted nucleic acid-binding protein
LPFSTKRIFTTNGLYDVPMDFADACLVRLSEIHAKSLVWTTDSDFNIYRRHGRQVVPVMAPWQMPTEIH